MSLQQGKKVVPPVRGDIKLENFSSVVQNSLAALYQAAHVHRVITADPTAADGNVGDIYLGDLAAGKKLYAKFSDGWYSVGLTKV